VFICFSDAHAAGYLNCQRVTYPCKNCGKKYSYYFSLARHLNHECGVEPKFHCPLCPYKTKHKSSLNTHLNGRHMKLLNEKYNLLSKMSLVGISAPSAPSRIDGSITLWSTSRPHAARRRQSAVRIAVIRVIASGT